MIYYNITHEAQGFKFWPAEVGVVHPIMDVANLRHMRDRFPSNRLVVISTISIFLLSIFLGGGIQTIQQALASNEWPSASGIIVESRLERSARTHASYSPIIRYSYVVNGTFYQNSRIDFGLFWGRRSSQQIIHAHAPGEKVSVYFSPENPQQAVLLNGLQAGSFQRLIMSTLIASFLVLFIWGPILARKYGTAHPDGTVWYGANSPGSKFIYAIAILIIIQFMLLLFLH